MGLRKLEEHRAKLQRGGGTWVMVSTTLALITMLTLRGPVPIFSKYFS